MSYYPPIAAKKKDIQEWVEGSVVSEAISSESYRAKRASGRN